MSHDRLKITNFKTVADVQLYGDRALPINTCFNSPPFLSVICICQFPQCAPESAIEFLLRNQYTTQAILKDHHPTIIDEMACLVRDCLSSPGSSGTKVIMYFESTSALFLRAIIRSSLISSASNHYKQIKEFNNSPAPNFTPIKSRCIPNLKTGKLHLCTS